MNNKVMIYQSDSKTKDGLHRWNVLYNAENYKTIYEELNGYFEQVKFHI